MIRPAPPLSLVPQVTAGLDCVGVRMPDHPVALALIELTVVFLLCLLCLTPLIRLVLLALLALAPYDPPY
jgi:hypothetical protein